MRRRTRWGSPGSRRPPNYLCILPGTPTGLQNAILRAATAFQWVWFSISRATSAVHPVWWLAPRPCPVSPWKYS